MRKSKQMPSCPCRAARREPPGPGYAPWTIRKPLVCFIRGQPTYWSSISALSKVDRGRWVRWQQASAHRAAGSHWQYSSLLVAITLAFASQVQGNIQVFRPRISILYQFLNAENCFIPSLNHSHSLTALHRPEGQPTFARTAATDSDSTVPTEPLCFRLWS